MVVVVEGGVFECTLLPGCLSPLPLQNLILSSKDEDDAMLTVIDFGFARILPEAPQVLTTPCYTLPYGAPEVLAHGNGYTEACDLWSLGVILVGKTLLVGD